MTSMRDAPLQCPQCGSSRLREATGSTKEPRRDGTVLAYGAPFTRCGKCGNEFVTGVQSRQADRARVAALRQADRLLPPDAIKDLRERCGLTQPAFESFLCAGRKTVARWELGVVAPHRTVDLLLRVLLESAQARAVCSRLTGVKIAEPETAAPVRSVRAAAGINQKDRSRRRSKSATGRVR